MTRVDFYVLADDCEQERVNMVCRLAEKAFRQSKSVFIHTDDDALADSVDEALWRFREDSFVPHRTVNRGDSAVAAQSGTPIDGHPEPVEIGCGPQPRSNHSVLINLGTDVPPFFSRFERTLEVVNQHQSIRADGRARYSFYQQRGYPLQHHKI